MWCDRCDLLRCSSCRSCLSLFSLSFLSQHVGYPVCIHCYKWPNYNFCISHGSVATVLKWGGQNKVVCVKFLLDVACQKLLKSANVSQLFKRQKWHVLYEPRCGSISINIFIICDLAFVWQSNRWLGSVRQSRSSASEGEVQTTQWITYSWCDNSCQSNRWWTCL